MTARISLALAAMALGAACYGGAFLEHQPCNTDDDCGPYACRDGFCNGPPPGVDDGGTGPSSTSSSVTGSPVTSVSGESSDDTTEGVVDDGDSTSSTSGSDCEGVFGLSVFGEACFG